eukprot:scaffold2262_cov107-Skeletonema_dohrnii-CCMP3373.AAC.1
MEGCEAAPRLRLGRCCHVCGLSLSNSSPIAGTSPSSVRRSGMEHVRLSMSLLCGDGGDGGVIGGVTPP